MPGHPLDRFGVEQVRAVLEITAQCSSGFHQVEPKVELRESRIDPSRRLDGIGLGPGSARQGKQLEHRLEQRVSPGVALGVQLRDQQLERHILVCVGLERDGANPLQHVTKCRISGQVGAEHERVDKEPDQALQLDAVSSGDRHPDGDIALIRVAVEKHDEGAQHRHEQRRVFALAQSLQVAMQHRVDCHCAAHAAKGRNPGSCAIGGKLQR